MYNLPDHALIDPEAATTAWMVWQPDEPVIVLGQSNSAEDSVDVDLAEKDGIPVVKRQSGGQTVILTPNTLVISVRLLSDKLENPQVYFKLINGLIIQALGSMGVKGLNEKGISDIAIGDRKILGSSIYRKRSMVFYHAVLNISESPEFIARYLRHPSKEPDYRAGRKHEDFVTSLRLAGYMFDGPSVAEQILPILSRNLQS